MSMMLGGRNSTSTIETLSVFVLASCIVNAQLSAIPTGPTPICGSSFDVVVSKAERIFQGQAADEHLGWSLSTGGDWNGDGLSEIMAGSTLGWDRTTVDNFVGSVQMFASATSTSCGIATPFLRINAELSGDRFAYALDFLGDLEAGSSTQDGRDDIAIGAPRVPYLGTGDNWNEIGLVYIYLSSQFQSAQTLGAAQASLIIAGDTVGGRLGYSLCRGGDIDNDLVPDLIVSAPGGKIDANLPGRVFVISGAEIRAKAASFSAGTGPQTVALSSFTALRIYTGDAVGDRFGNSVALVGDVGDDQLGYLDFVVGAPQWKWNGTDEVSTGPGYAKVILGTPGAHSLTFAGQTQSFLHQSQFGNAVAGQVDVNGDGKPDIIVAARRWADAATQLEDIGKVWVYSVVTGQVLVSHEGVGSEFFGNSISGLGKLELGTGPDYWAVGASSFTAPTTASDGLGCPQFDGQYFGRSCGRVYLYNGMHATSCMTLTGEDSKDSAGWSIARGIQFAGTPDLDVVITGMRWGDGPNPPEAGRVYVFVR